MRIRDCTAALLCGGKSSRMGFDKAFIKQGNGYLLEHTANALAALFESVVLVCDERQKLLAHPGFAAYPVLEDHYPGMGPLGGICTAFEETGAPYVFAMACDMPQPDFALVPKLYAALIGGAQVSLCAHGGKLEPLFAFYHRSCLPTFQRQLAENKAQPRREFARFDVRTLLLDDEKAGASFLNLNTPQEWRAWQTREAARTAQAEEPHADL